MAIVNGVEISDKDATISEKKFGQKVAAYARSHGWHLQRNSWMGVGNQYVKGFPDIVMVRDQPTTDGKKIIFVELKKAKGKLASAQAEWRDWIEAAGGEWELWRPQDWEAVKLRIK